MNGFLKYSERVMSATKRTDTDNTDDLRVSEMDRLVETGFCYRVVPDGLVALDLGVDVFAGWTGPWVRAIPSAAVWCSGCGGDRHVRAEDVSGGWIGFRNEWHRHRPRWGRKKRRYAQAGTTFTSGRLPSLPKATPIRWTGSFRSRYFSA